MFGLILIFKSSIKPRIKNNIEIYMYSNKTISFKKNRTQKIIYNEMNMPIPPIMGVGNLWKACGYLNWSSIKKFKIYLLETDRKK